MIYVENNDSYLLNKQHLLKGRVHQNCDNLVNFGTPIYEIGAVMAILIRKLQYIAWKLHYVHHIDQRPSVANSETNLCFW